jgi:polyhydroxybutyrate depolymerase
MEEVTGFSRIADREGFVAVYPDGLGVFGWAQAWNAGHCCGRGHTRGVDDVGFVRRLIVDLSARLGIDRDRVFVVGYSNGALLAYRIGAELSDIVAGIAPYAGTMRAHGTLRAPEINLAPPARPVSVFAAHSRADPYIAYEGALDGDSVDVSFAHAGRFWAVVSKCRGRAGARFERGGSVRIESYPGCAPGAEVKQVTLNGWDHEWPGPANTLGLPADHPIHGFDLAEAIWRFFASQRKRD